jgi:hypothetical protein
MGRCLTPCDGRVDPERYGELVRRLVSSLTSPGGLLGALERRMDDLSDQERYEEAGLVRDRLRALADALARARTDAWLVGSGTFTVGDADRTSRLNGGSLDRGDGSEPIPVPCPRERADELAAVRAWMRSHRPRIVEGEEGLAETVDGGAAIARIQAQARASDDRRAGARPRS